jgi:hypothetical protein
MVHFLNFCHRPLYLYALYETYMPYTDTHAHFQTAHIKLC